MFWKTAATALLIRSLAEQKKTSLAVKFWNTPLTALLFGQFGEHIEDCFPPWVTGHWRRHIENGYSATVLEYVEDCFAADWVVGETHQMRPLPPRTVGVMHR